MKSGLIFFILLSFSISHADLAEGPCSLELSGGYEDVEIKDLGARSVYDGIGARVTARYNALNTDKFHVALRVSLGYSELDNKANTSTLHESLQNTSWAPGIEFRLYSLLLGAEYKGNKSTMDMGGSSFGTVNTSFYAPQFFLGFDVPMDWWGFRLYYVRSEGNVPALDTGLTQDSPWQQEQLMIAFRINFRHQKSELSMDDYRSRASSTDRSYDVETSAAPSSSGNSQVYRPVRYFPRPSRSLGN